MKFDLVNPPKPGAELSDEQKIIVVVPDFEIDTIHTSQWVWEMAKKHGSQVFLLGVCSKEANEPFVRRQLTGISSLLEIEDIAVRTQVAGGSRWASSLRQEWRPGDLFVCFSGSMQGKASVNLFIEKNFDAPIFILQNTLQPARQHISDWTSNMLGWVGSLTILVSSFWLETKIIVISDSWAKNFLLYLFILVEAVALWGWNIFIKQ